MIGIKHEDKNKILDYCIRECVKKHDALLVDYSIDELSKNMGYAQRNKLITIS